MAVTKTTFKKGDNRKRKPKGALNRTTKQAKEILDQVMFGQIENMSTALDYLHSNDPARYLDACSKLFAYVLPKKTDLTSDDKPIVQQVTKIVIE